MPLTRNQTRRLRWVPAGNRFGMPRTVSASNSGFKFMSGRLHRSPNLAFSSLKVISPWYKIDGTNGEAAVGAGATIAAGIEYPIGTGCGASGAFRWGGSLSGSMVDFQNLESDPLAVLLPANSLYRFRSFVTPSTFACYGRAGIGTTGGSMSGYGGAVDMGVFSAAPTDETQSATAITAYTSDSAYEPLLLGATKDWTVNSWLIIGDSIAQGSLEISGTSANPASGAGDAYGNVGFFERYIGGQGLPHFNMAQAGSKAQVWATRGYAARRVGQFSQYSNKAVLQLGRNDITTVSSAQTIADLTYLYQLCDPLFDTVLVGTMLPYTTTTDSGATLVNQTVTASETKRTDVNAFIRGGTVIPLANVIDLEAIVRDPVEPTKWRVDGGVWSTDCTHPSVYGHTQMAAQLTF